jgi:hypothetical protein
VNAPSGSWSTRAPVAAERNRVGSLVLMEPGLSIENATPRFVGIVHALAVPDHPRPKTKAIAVMTKAADRRDRPARRRPVPCSIPIITAASLPFLGLLSGSAIAPQHYVLPLMGSPLDLWVKSGASAPA